MFVRVADHGTDAGQRRNFFGSALGIASGDDDFCQRILAPYAADGGASILIRGIRDRASIQNNKVGFSGAGADEAAVFELAFDGRPVGLGGATSEVFDVVGRHTTIVAHFP